MKNKSLRVIRALLSVVLAAALCGCEALRYAPPEPGDDEILLKIALDLEEDVGLILVDTEMNGRKTYGGSSNADRSMIKRDDVIYHSVTREDHGVGEDVSSTVLSVRIRVVTKYFTPNYENDYPEQYVMPTEELTFSASFGNSYGITVTGNNVKGYTARLFSGTE